MTRESNSGRRRRLTILVLGLTVLLGVTILLIATQREVSAQSADQVVWESELTVGESTRSTLGWHSFGDYDGEGLSDQKFGVRGWLYEITWIELVQEGTDSYLDLTLHQVNSDAAEWISDFTLDVDGTKFKLEDADFDSPLARPVTTRFRWDAGGVSWAKGDSVPLRITAPARRSLVVHPRLEVWAGRLKPGFGEVYPGESYSWDYAYHHGWSSADHYVQFNEHTNRWMLDTKWAYLDVLNPVRPYNSFEYRSKSYSLEAVVTYFEPGVSSSHQAVDGMRKRDIFLEFSAANGAFGRELIDNLSAEVWGQVYIELPGPNVDGRRYTTVELSGVDVTEHKLKGKETRRFKWRTDQRIFNQFTPELRISLFNPSPPVIEHVEVNQPPDDQPAFFEGDVIQITLVPDQPLTIPTDAGPSLKMRFLDRYSDYSNFEGLRTVSFQPSKSSNQALVFEYTVKKGDADFDGYQIESTSLDGITGITATANGKQLLPLIFTENPIFALDENGRQDTDPDAVKLPPVDAVGVVQVGHSLRDCPFKITEGDSVTCILTNLSVAAPHSDIGIFSHAELKYGTSRPPPYDQYEWQELEQVADDTPGGVIMELLSPGWVTPQHFRYSNPGDPLESWPGTPILHKPLFS